MKGIAQTELVKEKKVEVQNEPEVAGVQGAEDAEEDCQTAMPIVEQGTTVWTTVDKERVAAAWRWDNGGMLLFSRIGPL
ncbi:hypothetical protein LWI28_006151 [Acer negundo]|uniref:Uncharacterized protein n=1 Tax=Acer negundo TaxID=4023 RepID=A0AAD5ILP4_ACENE|nr:hypothetical protein LWI28_006151 [Acer negundo]